MVRLKAEDPGETSLRWLFLDLNSYFASVEQHLNPHLQGKPVAVLPVLADTTSVIAASYEAKAFGIKTGTPVWQARRLCPHLILLPAKHEHYVRLHHAIVAEVNQHLHVDQVCSIDEMACRLMGRETTPEGAVQLANTIKHALKIRIGPAIRCSIGIGPNRFWSKIGSDMHKPDGLVLLPHHRLIGVLPHLKLTDLPGVGHAMEIRLNRSGILSVASLWQLPPDKMRRLWGGIVGERFWHALHGYEMADTPEMERHSISHSHVLAPAARHHGRPVARRLMVKVASRLRRLSCLTSVLCLSVRIEDGPKLRVDMSLECATQDTLRLLRALEDGWQSLMQSSGTSSPRIKKIGIVLSGLTPQNAIQLSLFDQAEQLRTAPLWQVIDSLNARYGADTVRIGFSNRLKYTDMGAKVAFSRIPDAAEFHE